MDATPSADGERKFVTAIFADFKGFTSMAAEAALVRERLGGAYDRLIPALIRLGETVQKVVGDGIMALFGAAAGHAVNRAAGPIATRQRRRKSEEPSPSSRWHRSP